MDKGPGSTRQVVRVKGEMESFGSYLKKEREARKISVEEICRATKVRRKVVEAIEGDQREVLPPEVFVRGFIEAYARYIGVDPEEVMFRYDEWQRGYVAQRTEEHRRKRQKEVPKKGIVAVAIIVVIILIFLLMLLGQRSREDTREPPTTGAIREHKDVTSLDPVRPFASPARPMNERRYLYLPVTPRRLRGSCLGQPASLSSRPRRRYGSQQGKDHPPLRCHRSSRGYVEAQESSPF